MRGLWAVARLDLAVWMRSPWAIACALLPPLGMAVLVAVLTASVGRQPVALVMQGTGPLAQRMERIIQADSEAYTLHVVDGTAAVDQLNDQSVAAIVLVPDDFDAQVAADDAHLQLYLNNVDIDFADDIRRTVERSVAEFDAPDLGVRGELRGGREPVAIPNPYRLAVAEHDLRQTTVDLLHYQVLPVLVLIIVSVGVLGSALLCARDRERRTGKLLMATPLRHSTILAGRLLGGVVTTLALLVPLLVVGVAARLLTPPVGHWPVILALCAVVTVLSVGLGLVVGVAVRDSRLSTMVAVIVATYLFFLGGGFTTIAFLPDWVQAASRLVPTRYAIDGLRQALFYPDLSGVAWDLLALCVSAAIAVGVGTAALGRSWRAA